MLRAHKPSAGISVIPNAVDGTTFTPDPTKRTPQRSGIGLNMQYNIYVCMFHWIVILYSYHSDGYYSDIIQLP